MSSQGFSMRKPKYRLLHVSVDFVDDNLDFLISEEYIEASFTARHLIC